MSQLIAKSAKFFACFCLCLSVWEEHQNQQQPCPRARTGRGRQGRLCSKSIPRKAIWMGGHVKSQCQAWLAQVSPLKKADNWRDDEIQILFTR